MPSSTTKRFLQQPTGSAVPVPEIFQPIGKPIRTSQVLGGVFIVPRVNHPVDGPDRFIIVFRNGHIAGCLHHVSQRVIKGCVYMSGVFQGIGKIIQFVDDLTQLIAIGLCRCRYGHRQRASSCQGEKCSAKSHNQPPVVQCSTAKATFPKGKLASQFEPATKPLRSAKTALKLTRNVFTKGFGRPGGT